MLALLQALTLCVWSHAHPAFAASPDAQPLASAIATAVSEDAARAPVFGSHAEDAAVMAQVVLEESNVQLDPRPQSWDAKAHVSCGAFQLPCNRLPATLTGQARMALWLLHRGRDACPDSPASSYLGGCHGLARAIGDRRVIRARAALRLLLAAAQSEE